MYFTVLSHFSALQNYVSLRNTTRNWSCSKEKHRRGIDRQRKNKDGQERKILKKTENDFFEQFQFDF